jgi:hypothetical protein
MGVRRRQLHNLIKSPSYDPLASVEGKLYAPELAHV